MSLPLDFVKQYLRKTKRLKTLEVLESTTSSESKKMTKLSFEILKPPERKKQETNTNQNNNIRTTNKNKKKERRGELVPKKFRKIAKLFGIPEEHLEFFYENRKRFTWNIKEKPKVHCTEQHCKYSAEFEGHSLDDHMIEAHNYRDIQCKEPNCSYLAYSPKSIAQHKSRFHGTGSRNSNLRFDFKCRYSNCNFSAKCVFLLDSHYKIHENRLVACICCQFRTSDPKSMKNHMMSHFNLQSLECEICKRKFNTPSAIRTHERYRHAEMQKCEDCGATFKTYGSLRKHR